MLSDLEAVRQSVSGGLSERLVLVPKHGSADRRWVCRCPRDPGWPDRKARGASTSGITWTLSDCLDRSGVPYPSDMLRDLREPSDAPVAADEPREPPAGLRRSMGARLAGGMAVGLVLVAVPVLTLLGFQSHSRFERAQRSIGVIRAELHRATADLAQLRSERASVTTQADATGASLTEVSDQLSTVQSELTKDESSLFVQGVSIAALNNCLGGVQDALNLIALGNSNGAVTALNEVSSSCKLVEAGAG